MPRDQLLTKEPLGFALGSLGYKYSAMAPGLRISEKAAYRSRRLIIPSL